MKEFIRKHSYLIISIIALLVIVAIISLSLFRQGNHTSQLSTTDNSSQSSNDSSTSTNSTDNIDQAAVKQGKLVSDIRNFHQVVQTLPDSEYQAIKAAISYTLISNGINDDSKISDATIRNGSYSQSISDPQLSIYVTNFIVDIPSIKQSYNVQDTWSPLSTDVTHLYDYTTLVTCLDSSQLIYGNFNCTDRLKQETGR